MILKGGHITLRPLSIDDLPACTRWAADEDNMKHVVGRTFTAEEERIWLENILHNQDEKVFMIITDNGKEIGTCGIHLKPNNPYLPQEEGVSLGIMIGEKSEWGKGYGPDAMQTLCQHVHDVYGAKRVWLTVDSVHKRAIRAYEKAGFVFVKEFDAPDRPMSEGKQWLMEKRFL